MIGDSRVPTLRSVTFWATYALRTDDHGAAEVLASARGGGGLCKPLVRYMGRHLTATVNESNKIRPQAPSRIGLYPGLSIDARVAVLFSFSWRNRPVQLYS